jgi:hypothetical protein
LGTRFVSGKPQLTQMVTDNCFSVQKVMKILCRTCYNRWWNIHSQVQFWN